MRQSRPFVVAMSASLPAGSASVHPKAAGKDRVVSSQPIVGVA
jgi:hypothetical protein